ncbi:MAG: helix-turn-helix transcriptional regulator [Lachnospiraceae bacterium]
MSVQTIETMARWVEANVTESPTLQDMSSYVGYSPYYCSAKFREHMGMTYKQFLSQCRIRAAASDLSTTNDKIIEIAFRYGYSSSEAFARAFSQTFHCPPRRYRESCTVHSGQPR